MGGIIHLFWRRGEDFQELGRCPLLGLLTVPWNCHGVPGCAILLADWGSRPILSAILVLFDSNLYVVSLGYVILSKIVPCRVPCCYIVSLPLRNGLWSRFYMWPPPSLMKFSPLAQCKSRRWVDCVFTGNSREQKRVRRGGKRWQGTQDSEAAADGQGMSKRGGGGEECGPERELGLAQPASLSQCLEANALHLPSFLIPSPGRQEKILVKKVLRIISDKNQVAETSCSSAFFSLFSSLEPFLYLFLLNFLPLSSQGSRRREGRENRMKMEGRWLKFGYVWFPSWVWDAGNTALFQRFSIGLQRLNITFHQGCLYKTPFWFVLIEVYGVSLWCTNLMGEGRSEELRV